MTVRRVASLLAVLITLASAAVVRSQGAEEAAILAVLDETLKATNNDDLKRLLDQYAEDAQIDSRAARARVSREKFGEAMQALFKSGNLINVEHRDRKVTLIDPTHASVLGTSYITTKTNRSTARVEWKLEKRDGRWVIVELNAK
jgi:uncharacterized protein (TIGR02246 family)